MQEAATDRFRERRLSIQSHITGQTVSIDHTDSSAPSVTSVDSASEAPSGVATSVMIRNIPCRYTQTKLVEEIQELDLPFDFLYLPPAKHSRGNLGYGFINFETNEAAATFMQIFNGHKFKSQPNSTKRAETLYCAMQGFEANYQFYGGYSRGRFRPFISEAQMPVARRFLELRAMRGSQIHETN